MPKFIIKFKSSKTRNIAILVFFLIISFLLFGVYWYLRGADTLEVSEVKVPKVPERIEFEPGAKDIPKEYMKTLLESERIAAEEALRRGESSVPGIIRIGNEVEVGGEELTGMQKDCLKQCVECCRGVGTSALLNQWVKDGNLSAEVAAEISKMQDQEISVNEYAENLNRLVREGKITPDQAKALLAAYKREKERVEVPEEKKEEVKPPEKVVEEIVSSTDLLNQMVSAGKIDPDAANELRELQRGGKSVSEYADSLNTLVKAGKITPEQAKQLLEAYRKEKTLPTLREYDKVMAELRQDGKVNDVASERLNRLSSLGVPASEYAAELNRLVEEGIISPETANKLLASYRKTYGDTRPTTTSEQIQAVERAQQRRALMEQQEALIEKERAIEEAQKRKEEGIALRTQKQQQNLQQAIGKQAQSLFSSWNVVPQVYVSGGKKDQNGKDVKSSNSEGSSSEQQYSSNTPWVKAGDIMFAVLDTSINSDQPGPVLATLVSGPFKGSKLLGSLTVTPDSQRVMLKFNLLNSPDFPKSVSINAVAINPDTARTAIASSVDNHYLLRYGSLFASNFMYGYAEAIKSSGTVEEEEISGEDKTKYPDLSAREKFLVGLGEVGNKLSSAWDELFNKKPTVKVEAGVGLGILFLGDVRY